MTFPARILLIALLGSLAAGLYLSAFGPAAAAQSFAVTVAPKQNAFPTGADAAFSVRVEGQTTALPSFDYSIEGGSLSGVLPPNPVAANVAEGTVFVNRATPGTARLTVSFAGEVLATAEARFGAVGHLQVQATLDAGPDAAARTWRFEVVNTSGQVVGSLSLSTSGDAPTGSTSTAALPHGFYTVRQVLGGDTRTAAPPAPSTRSPPRLAPPQRSSSPRTPPRSPSPSAPAPTCPRASKSRYRSTRLRPAWAAAWSAT